MGGIVKWLLEWEYFIELISVRALLAIAFEKGFRNRLKFQFRNIFTLVMNDNYLIITNKAAIMLVFIPISNNNLFNSLLNLVLFRFSMFLCCGFAS